jgi:hypothetical protein
MTIPKLLQFVIALGVLAAAGKALTQAGAALGLPRGVVALLASFIAP